MILFGQPIFIWFGMLAFLFIISAVSAVYLGRKYKQIARGRWHQKLARFGVGFMLIHAVLAFMRIFLNIYI
ncbi:MAG: hypothetical protein NUK65_08750 [Firmicutes bacterium]|nr:hypothetical protein [Bacillota bacterium]